MGLVRSVPQSVKSSTPLPLATLRPTTAIGLESWTGPVSNHKEMTVRRKLASEGWPVFRPCEVPRGERPIHLVPEGSAARGVTSRYAFSDNPTTQRWTKNG
jgi:hypothetical protein